MSEANKLARELYKNPQELYKNPQKAADKYWSGAHTKHRLRYHLVFIPKYRKRVLEGKVAARLEQLLRQACEVNRWGLEELAIQPDHVHLLVQVQPRYSVSTIMKRLKGGSSHVLRAVMVWLPP
jgi:putative transposase